MNEMSNEELSDFMDEALMGSDKATIIYRKFSVERKGWVLNYLEDEEAWHKVGSAVLYDELPIEFSQKQLLEWAINSGHKPTRDGFNELKRMARTNGASSPGRHPSSPGRHPSSPGRKALVKVMLDMGDNSPARICATLERFEANCPFDLDNINIEIDLPAPRDARYNAIRNDVNFFKCGKSLLPEQNRNNTETIKTFKKWLKSQGT